MGSVPHQRLTRRASIKRVIVLAASALVAVNIWTGAPLLALWLGSRLVGHMGVSMQGIGIVVAVLAATVYSMTYLLLWLNEAYRRLAGDTNAPQRRPAESQWLSRLSEEYDRKELRSGLTPVEWATVISVHLAVVALFLWIVFVPGSPTPLLTK